MTVGEYLIEESKRLYAEFEGYMMRGVLFDTETYMHMIDERTGLTNFDATQQIQAQLYQINRWTHELPVEILMAVMTNE